jgi:hypothetical protein
VEEPNNGAELLIAQLRSSTEQEAADLLYQLRNSDENVDSIAESLRLIVKIPHKTDAGGLEGEYSQFNSEIKAGQNFRYGATSNLGFIPTEKDYNPSQSNLSLNATWTDVTKDIGFVRHLTRLYFTWCNPFYPLLDGFDFYHDMESGETNYCSSLLVNSICAYACHFTDLPAARKNYADAATAGDHFFEAARIQLFNDETSCLTTVQALAIMGSREVSAGRDSSGFQYAGRCMRMGVELGIHLEGTASEPLSEKEVAARNRAFWGIFTYDA